MELKNFLKIIQFQKLTHNGSRLCDGGGNRSRKVEFITNV
jgi:hypothetical protein